MKKAPIIILLFAIPVWAGKRDTNPAHYPEKAHVVSAQSRHIPNGHYDAASQKWIYGAINTATIEIQIGNIVYMSDETCKGATVGQDFPAQFNTKNGVVRLLVKKVCAFEVVGTREK